jgi:hypothetical protein
MDLQLPVQSDRITIAVLSECEYDVLCVLNVENSMLFFGLPFAPNTEMSFYE